MVAVVVFSFVKRRRRARVSSREFPDRWKQILERNLAPYHALSPDEQLKLQRDMLVFLAEKNFEGGGGLQITDEIMLTIAANACLLLLHRDHNFYPRLKSIVVYPSVFTVRHHHPLPGGVVGERTEHRAGESWEWGTVVLAWDEVERSVSIRDGYNVTLHEFAHQLDQEDGISDGAPVLGSSSRYAEWSRVFRAEFEELVRAAAEGRETILRHYGATNPAEFFAVATECFLENPADLQRMHPALYEQLKLYYGQDPVAREPREGAERGA